MIWSPRLFPMMAAVVPAGVLQLLVFRAQHALSQVHVTVTGSIGVGGAPAAWIERGRGRNRRPGRRPASRHRTCRWPPLVRGGAGGHQASSSARPARSPGVPGAHAADQPRSNPAPMSLVGPAPCSDVGYCWRRQAGTSVQLGRGPRIRRKGELEAGLLPPWVLFALRPTGSPVKPAGAAVSRR